jgi:hypothetical protein
MKLVMVFVEQRSCEAILVGGIPTPLKNMSSSVGMIIPNCNIWKHEKCSKPSAIFKYQIIIMTIGEYYILIKNYSLLIRGKLYSSWNTNMAAKATKVQQVIYGIG